VYKTHSVVRYELEVEAVISRKTNPVLVFDVLFLPQDALSLRESVLSATSADTRRALLQKAMPTEKLANLIKKSGHAEEEAAEVAQLWETDPREAVNVISRMSENDSSSVVSGAGGGLRQTVKKMVEAVDDEVADVEWKTQPIALPEDGSGLRKTLKMKEIIEFATEEEEDEEKGEEQEDDEEEEEDEDDDDDEEDDDPPSRADFNRLLAIVETQSKQISELQKRVSDLEK
jgi:hypothetical protein